MTFVKTGFATVAFLLILCLPAIAQRAESGGTGEGAWQLVKQPMELPDLPKYTGRAVFVNGLMYPNKPGGPAITLHYQAGETPDVVLQWYGDALKNFDWKIDKGTSENSLKAFHGKNGLTINVSTAKSKKFRTDLRISYKLHK